MAFYDNFSALNVPALQNGVRLPEFKPSEEQYAYAKLPNTVSSKEFIRELCRIGFKEKVKNSVPKEQHQVYIDRVKEELDIIEQLGFIDYILMVWDICDFCKHAKIPTGPGRGSVSSSLVCYLIGITKVDAIKHGTFFTRFLSKSRAKYKMVDGIKYIEGSLAPDIDQDIDFLRRQEVIQYLQKKYPARTCKLLTTQTLSSKILIKEVLKKYEEAHEEQANFASGLMEKIHGIPQEIRDALSDDKEKENEKFKEWAKDHKETVAIALKLAGLQKSMGIHASALAISFDPIDTLIPMQLSAPDAESKEMEVVTAYDMYSAQEICLKFDLLGLKTVSLIDDVCKQIGIKADDIDVNHPSIYEFLQGNRGLHGIFQFESHSQGEISKKIKPKIFKQIVDALAISRPGASSFLSQYIDYVHRGEYKTIHPLIDPIMKETGGVCLFQETLLKMVNTLGLELDECEGLRKAIGKKLPDKIKEYKEKIYTICEKNGHPKEVADLIWKIAEDSAGYQFNLSHSIAYGMISAQTVYLKANYPKEFFLGCLHIAREDSKKIEKIGIISQEMKQYGFEMLPPDLVASDLDFKIEANGIRYGLSFIKGVSDKTIEKLQKFRAETKINKFQVFQSLNQVGLNIGVGSSLIQAGCMTEFSKSRSRLVLELQTWNILTPAEKKLAMTLGEKFSYDLLNLLLFLRDNKNDKGKLYIKETRFETIKTKYNVYKAIYSQNSKNEQFANWFYEKTVLGFSYSSTLKDVFDSHIKGLRALADINSEVPDIRISGIAVVKKCYTAKSKAGNPYAKINIEDETGEAQIKIFNQKLQLCKEVNGGLPEEEDIVIFKGTTKEGCIFADEVVVQNSKIYMRLRDVKEDIKDEAKN